MESITDKQDTDCSGFFGWDDLENVEGDDSDKHHGENQERPGGGEGLEVVGVVEPDHEHGERDYEREDQVDPKEGINERGVDKTTRDGCIFVSRWRTSSDLLY